MPGKVLCRSFAKQVSERRQIARKLTKKRGPPEQSESCFEHLCTTENTRNPLGTLKGGGPTRAKFRDAKGGIMSGRVLCRSFAKQVSEQTQIAHKFTKTRVSGATRELLRAALHHRKTQGTHWAPLKGRSNQDEIP